MNDTLSVIGGCCLAIFAVFIAIFIYAAIGCWLWGLIMVPVFGLPYLTYWQMFGLMWLSRLIFGSFNTSTSTSSKRKS
jgi:energy-coupling factor transporter transmembrane protein EcfT